MGVEEYYGYQYRPRSSKQASRSGSAIHPHPEDDDSGDNKTTATAGKGVVPHPRAPLEYCATFALRPSRSLPMQCICGRAKVVFSGIIKNGGYMHTVSEAQWCIVMVVRE